MIERGDHPMRPKLFEAAVFLRIPRNLKDKAASLAKQDNCYEADVFRAALKEGLKAIARRTAKAEK